MRPINDIMVHEGGALVAGAGLRVAWSRGPMIGYVGTAAAVALGLLGDQFFRGQSARRALEGFAAGATAIGGWVGTEKLVYKGGSAPIPARLHDGYSQARIDAARQRALNAGGANAGMPLRQPLPERTRTF